MSAVQNNKTSGQSSKSAKKGRTPTAENATVSPNGMTARRPSAPKKNHADRGRAPKNAADPSGITRPDSAPTGHRPRGAGRIAPPAAETEQNRPTAPKKKQRAGGRAARAVSPVRFTVLGGLNEIGKNMAVVEYGNDALVIDCGMAFPDDDMLGVDIVLPDITYLEKIRDHIRGVVVTHGHEDHIGAAAYLLGQINVPLYATPLTVALVEAKLKEDGQVSHPKLNVVHAGETVKLGCMSVEFIHVNHSIPDAVALAIRTPVGILVHTGDFKVDFTPIQSRPIDLARFAALGDEGVLALMADSTNVERQGYTPSERVVGNSFEHLFQQAAGRRIIVATFSSNLHRIQQIMDEAVALGRKVAVSGRSMINFVNIARQLDYLTVPDNVLVDIETIDRYPKDRMLIVTTGSQGEPMSALSRMAFSDHRQVVVGPEDFIVISATPIPGNEKTVGRVVNELMKRGCEVVYEKMYDVHVSGHACQEELKLIHGLVRPRFFIPVHGEQKHLHKHAALARSMGMPAENVLISDIGKTVEITPDSMKIAGTVPSGQVLVDGLGIGDVGSVVLRDRRRLAQDGLLVVVATVDPLLGEVVSGPDIVSRGFIYVKEAEELMDEARAVVREVLEKACIQHPSDWTAIKTRVRDELSRMLFQKTRRNPMILPVIMEV